jgi:hypothetical protein
LEDFQKGWNNIHPCLKEEGSVVTLVYDQDLQILDAEIR